MSGRGEGRWGRPEAIGQDAGESTSIVDGGEAVARRVSHTMPRMTNQKFSCIRMNIRNCSRSALPKTKRQCPVALATHLKTQLPQEEVADRMDGAASSRFTTRLTQWQIAGFAAKSLPRGKKAFAHKPVLQQQISFASWKLAFCLGT